MIFRLFVWVWKENGFIYTNTISILDNPAASFSHLIFVTNLWELDSSWSFVWVWKENGFHLFLIILLLRGGCREAGTELRSHHPLFWKEGSPPILFFNNALIMLSLLLRNMTQDFSKKNWGHIIHCCRRRAAPPCSSNNVLTFAQKRNFTKKRSFVFLRFIWSW